MEEPDSKENTSFSNEEVMQKNVRINLAESSSTAIVKLIKSEEAPKGIIKETNKLIQNYIRDYSEDIKDILSINDSRPHNLQEFINKENLAEISIENTLSLDGLSDDDEIWILNMPKTINPELLEGQSLLSRDKSKLKVGDNNYLLTHQDVKGSLTLVLSTSKESEYYKAVNIKPKGMIQVRQKLSVLPKMKHVLTKKTKVPFPTNIRHRDPFLGVIREVCEYKNRVTK